MQHLFLFVTSFIVMFPNNEASQWCHEVCIFCEAGYICDFELDEFDSNCTVGKRIYGVLLLGSERCVTVDTGAVITLHLRNGAGFLAKWTSDRKYRISNGGGRIKCWGTIFDAQCSCSAPDCYEIKNDEEPWFPPGSEPICSKFCIFCEAGYICSYRFWGYDKNCMVGKDEHDQLTVGNKQCHYIKPNTGISLKLHNGIRGWPLEWSEHRTFIAGTEGRIKCWGTIFDPQCSCSAADCRETTE